MTLRQKAVLATALGAGFAGGLALTGQLALTTPTVAQTPRPAPPAAAPVPASLPAGPASLPDLSTIAESALKVSVNISSTTIVRPPDDPVWRFFYGNRVQQSQSLGSGVVVSRDGYILTNTHVVGNAGAAVRVTLENGREMPARLEGIDEVSDLAVVKVEAANLPSNLQTLPWGDSSRLRVAEWVLAVGNPFQLSGTVTLGIVSTINRSGELIGSSQDFIQTDAAINPGNSGGALVSARGELVGINTMIYSETGGNQGIGFAIPSNTARRIMDELVKNGRVTWGAIGDVGWVTIDRAAADWYGLDVTGAFVRDITRTSSAYRAGLQPGDIVVSVNDQPVANGEQIERAVVRLPIGSTVTLGVMRQGRRLALDVPVVARR